MNLWAIRTRARFNYSGPVWSKLGRTSGEPVDRDGHTGRGKTRES